jgi:hypothetical protein
VPGKNYLNLGAAAAIVAAGAAFMTTMLLYRCAMSWFRVEPCVVFYELVWRYSMTQ